MSGLNTDWRMPGGGVLYGRQCPYCDAEQTGTDREAVVRGIAAHIERCAPGLIGQIDSKGKQK